MANRSREFNVAHSLTANLASCDFNAAALAHDALVLDLFVSTAGAFPVFDWSEDALAEQAISLGLERAVIDRLRLLDFTMRPTHDVFAARYSDSDFIEQADVCHKFLLSPQSKWVFGAGLWAFSFANGRLRCHTNPYSWRRAFDESVVSDSSRQTPSAFNCLVKEPY